MQFIYPHYYAFFQMIATYLVILCYELVISIVGKLRRQLKTNICEIIIFIILRCHGTTEL